MNDITLRTQETQDTYEEAMKTGESKDIAKLKGPGIGGLKLLDNAYGYDLVYGKNDMLVDKEDSFWDAWIKTGLLMKNGLLPYDQMLINMPHMMSQSHVWHCQLVNIDKEKVQLFRKCWTYRDEIKQLLEELDGNL